ncbi:phosphoserine phosphatase RsbX [Halalkalibacter wakoensis JCM 9140]|uniref:Phosphoserine phosphatase RsbX n=1 Tax=Halalkalibacter wakoensis JCM 9140 TaxID=1236970 RepID=W4Q539_9BACI|nr:SpoIIE family protein phosphatase [Halalkalibacter wakoensis]GAE26454.1 phosphoserine phosphatase RsbX [Halalkalibacter wakoensis JCM 9140]
MISTYANEKIKVTAYERAKHGNSCSGDTHVFIESSDYVVCAVIDGLGSGEGAFQSAIAALNVIQSHHHLAVSQMVGLCNDALGQKRGVVLTVVKFDLKEQLVDYCNVGNIGFVMYLPDGKTIQPVPARGYLSGKKQTFAQNSFPYLKDSVFMLYSDGVKKKPSKQMVKDLAIGENGSDQVLENDWFAADDVTILFGKLY